MKARLRIVIIVEEKRSKGPIIFAVTGPRSEGVRVLLRSRKGGKGEEAETVTGVFRRKPNQNLLQ